MTRAQVVILRGDRILLCRHTACDRTYWVLPGGGVEPGERPEDAAAREVEEESGLQVRIDRLLFTEEPGEAGNVRIRQPRFTYLATVMGGELELREDPDRGSPKGYLCGCAWMPFESEEYDASTRNTLLQVRNALSPVE